MESGAALRASRISAFLSIKYWSTGTIFEYLSDCAAAFGTRKPMLITSTRAMILIILSLVGRPHREVSFRRRCSLSLMISFYIRRRTYLDCSTLQLHSRTLGNELNCVIQISRFKHLNSTQLLLRFRVRTVCHHNLSVLPTHGHRRVGGL